jgi:hypothetical protein
MIVLSIDPGYKNGGVCEIDISPGFPPEIIRWEELHVVPEAELQPSKGRICECVAEFVARNTWMFLEPDVVLFETQMKINGGARCFVAALKGALTVQAQMYRPNAPLVFLKIKPTKKFEVFGSKVMSDYPTMKVEGSREDHYFYRKRWSVELANRLLENLGDEARYFRWVVFRKRSRQNRDMADAFTNAVAEFPETVWDFLGY